MKLFFMILMILLTACSDKNRPDQTILPSGEPEKLTIRLEKTLTGHRGFLFFLCFSSDNQYLASGSADQSVKIWSSKTWTEIRTLSERYYELWGIPLHFSKNNQYLATGAYENLKLFQQMNQFQNTAAVLAHNKGIQSLYFAPDSQTLSTAGVDGVIRIWQVPQLKMLTNIKAHQSEIWSIAISPDGTKLISGGEDGYIKLWEYPQMNLIKQMKQHDLPVEYVRFSHNGKRFLGASADSTISVWNMNNLGSPYRILRGHMGSVLVADFSIDDQVIFSGGDDDLIYVYDYEKDQILNQLKDHFGDVMTLAVSSDGQYLASGSRDRTIKIWKLKYE